MEQWQINLQRKSLFTSQALQKNDALTLENIAIKGPGHGLLPKYLPVILGKRVTKDIEKDMPITWDDVLSV